MRNFFLGPLVAIGILAPLAAASATVYTFTRFDAPGALQSANSGTQITGINNVGQISGDLLSGNYPSGFVFDTTTNAFTSYSDYDVRGINDSGNLVAIRLNGSLAVLIDRNGQTELRGNLPPTVTGINNSLDAVGYFANPSRRYTSYQGFIETISNYNFGAPSTFDDPLGVTANQTSTKFYDINNVGQVAGSVFTITNQTQGFLFNETANTYTPIVVPGALSTQAYGLNDTGQIVGVYSPAANTTDAFVFDLAAGTYTTLMAPGAVNTAATGVADNGVVAGYYIDGSGIYHGFFATPQASAAVPEPASIALLGSLVVAAGSIRNRRRSRPTNEPAQAGRTS